VSLFEGHSAQWKTSVHARGHVKALLLTRDHLRTLLHRRPEAEVALRAGLLPSLPFQCSYNLCTWHCCWYGPVWSFCVLPCYLCYF
jgi:hypothetical protein